MGYPYPVLAGIVHYIKLDCAFLFFVITDRLKYLPNKLLELHIILKQYAKLISIHYGIFGTLSSSNKPLYII